MINLNSYSEYLSEILGPKNVIATVDINSHGVNEVSILEFKEKPSKGFNTYVTVGLSQTQLPSEGKLFRQELLMSLPDVISSTEVAPILVGVGEELINRHRGLHNAEILGRRGPLFENFKQESLITMLPFHISRDLYLYNNGVSKVLTLWLVPVLQKEVDYIKNGGAEEFEEKVYSRNIGCS